MGGYIPPKKKRRTPPPPKAVEQPKVVSQMDAPQPIDAPAGPTDIEMDQDESLKTKRKGRRKTILTSSQGLGENIELGKKTLLG